MKVTDALIKPLIFISFCYYERVQSWIPNHDLSSWTLKNTIVYISTFPAKIYRHFFKIKEKPYFGIICAQSDFFLKALAKYNCSGPPAFKCKTYTVDYHSNQILFHHYEHANIIQSICSIHQIICEIHLI